MKGETKMRKSIILLLIAFNVGILFIAHATSEDKTERNEPKLIEQAIAPNELDSEDLRKLILDNNKCWLDPKSGSFSYEFSMKHENKNDIWKANVDIVSGSKVSINTNKGKNYEGTLNNKYDPHNSAYPPKLLTILQGTTFFGPLHELCWAQNENEVKLVSQGAVNGKKAWVGQILPTGHPSKKAMKKWEERLRKRATRPKYLYEFIPQKDKDGNMVIEINCVHSQGSGWTDILSSHEQNPSKIIWGGKIISAEIRDFRGKETPVIVLERDNEYIKESPITKVIFENGVNNMTKKLMLGEGPDFFDKELFEKLKEEEAKPRRYLPMRVGCGIWGCWYGYSGGGADIDQVWIEKSTGLVLKEEGFREGECCFTIDYGDYEKVANEKKFPKHITITLYGKRDYYPWIFDMRFDIYKERVWLLNELTEKKSNTRIDAKAQAKNVILKNGD